MSNPKHLPKSAARFADAPAAVTQIEEPQTRAQSAQTSEAAAKDETKAPIVGRGQTEAPAPVAEAVVQKPQVEAKAEPKVEVVVKSGAAAAMQELSELAPKLAEDGYPGLASLCEAIPQYADAMRRPGPTSAETGRWQQTRLWQALSHTLDHTKPSEKVSLVLIMVLTAMHEDIREHGYSNSAFSSTMIMRYSLNGATILPKGYSKVLPLISMLAALGPAKRAEANAKISLDSLQRDLSANAMSLLRNYFSGL